MFFFLLRYKFPLSRPTRGTFLCNSLLATCFPSYPFLSCSPCLPACLVTTYRTFPPFTIPSCQPASLQPTHITTELLPLPLHHPCSSTTVRGLHPQFFLSITVCLLLLYSNFYIIFCIFCYHSLWLGGARFFFYALGLPCFFSRSTLDL